LSGQGAGQRTFGGKERRGSCLCYDAYRKMIAVKMVFVEFGGGKPQIGGREQIGMAKCLNFCPTSLYSITERLNMTNSELKLVDIQFVAQKS